MFVTGGTGPAGVPGGASGTGSSRFLQKGPGGFPPNESNVSVVAPCLVGIHSPELDVPCGSALFLYWDPLCTAMLAPLASRLAQKWVASFQVNIIPFATKIVPSTNPCISMLAPLLQEGCHCIMPDGLKTNTLR